MNVKSLFKIVSLALLFLGISSVSFAQISMSEFFEKWNKSEEFTLEVVAMMPEELIEYRPHPTAMTFNEQIAHLSLTMVRLSKGFLNGEEPAFDTQVIPATRHELMQYVKNCYAYSRVSIKALSSDQLDERLDSFVGNVSRRQIIALMDDHTTHHRGAAISYLRANGIEPPRYRGI
jgi:uncharacterized damage-inducible protein DinB